MLYRDSSKIRSLSRNTEIFSERLDTENENFPSHVVGKSQRFISLDISPSRPNAIVAYEITAEGIRGIRP
jgi:hypothetical protein